MPTNAKQLPTGPALLAVLLLVFALPAQAAFKSPLNLSPFNPDLQVLNSLGGLDLSYTYAPGDRSSVLSIAGSNQAGSYVDLDNSGLTGGGLVDFTLTVNLLSDGSSLNTALTNTLLIEGTNFVVGTEPAFTGVILSGTVFDFGINTVDSTNTGTFEFLVGNLQSDNADLFNWNLNSVGQVIASFNGGLEDNSSFSATDNFSGSGGVADNSVSVPLPGSIALLGLGILGLRLARSGSRQD